jgi:hypothetical protein
MQKVTQQQQRRRSKKVRLERPPSQGNQRCHSLSLPTNLHIPLKNSSQSSKTRFTKSSYPRSVPCNSRPPKHLTRTTASLSLASSRMDSFRGGAVFVTLVLLLLLLLLLLPLIVWCCHLRQSLGSSRFFCRLCCRFSSAVEVGPRLD